VRRFSSSIGIGRAAVVVIVVVVIVIAAVGAYVAIGLGAPKGTTTTSSVSSSSTTSTVSPTQGGTLNLAFPSEESASFDPVSAVSGDFTETALYNMYEPLAIYDSNFALKPDLATSWTQPNATTFVFDLRQNVKFQDGTPFNSSAVVFSINRGLQNASLLKTMVDVVKSVVALNNTAVQFNLKPSGPIANFFAELAYEPGLIVSPTAVAKYGSSYGQHPVGTGPFMFTDFQANDHLTLSANPNYWGGKPYLDKVVLHVIPDASTTAESLQTGSIQLAPVSAQIASQLSGQSLSVSYSPPYKSIMAGLNVKDPIMKSPLVRQAVNYAIDRGAIIGALEGGHAIAAYTSILPYMTGAYNTSQNPYPLHGDSAKARSLLAQAGYPNGINITIMVSGSFVNGLTIATIMQQQMALAKINVNIQNVPFGQFVQAIIFKHNYTMGIFDYSAGVTPAYQLFDLYSPTSFFDLQSINDSQINTLLKQLVSTTDTNVSNQIAQQIQNMAIAKAYGCFIYYPQKAEVLTPKLHGLTPLIVANTVPIIADSAALGINLWLSA
jgi:peptide/nickel transport system substrate-binding protein